MVYCTGARRAKRGLLTMSPQFEHDLQPESAEQALASGSEISPAEIERMPSEAGLRESAPAGMDAEPDQDEARGPSGSQEAGSLTASGNMTGSPKTAGNGIKKKNNRKKGGSKEIPVKRVTARGILEGPPTPAAPPAARIPQPPSSLVEPSNDAPAPDAATEPFGPEPKHGPNTARQHKQPKPEAEAVTDGEPELFNRLHISMPVDSEEEQYHDAGSGFESAAQLGGLGSRRTSLGSDLCFEDAPETPSEPTWPSKYPEPKVPVQAAGPEHDTSEVRTATPGLPCHVIMPAVQLCCSRLDCCYQLCRAQEFFWGRIGSPSIAQPAISIPHEGAQAAGLSLVLSRHAVLVRNRLYRPAHLSSTSIMDSTLLADVILSAKRLA